MMQEKPSALKREHPALKNKKFLIFVYFRWSFLPSWIRIRIQPTKINADPCGSGSATLAVANFKHETVRYSSESSETKTLSFKKQHNKFGAALALHLYSNSQGY
jgi:hypothetical protein